VPLPVVRSIARQLLEGLDQLHREQRIIHTDIKPENVALAQPLYDRVWTPVVAAPPRVAVPPAREEAREEEAITCLTKSQKRRQRRRRQLAAAVQAGEAAARQAGVRPLQGGRGGQGITRGSVPSRALPDGVLPVGALGLSPPIRQAGGPPGLLQPHRSAREHQEALAAASCRLIDFGNACWTHRQFTDDVQTRQYRAPEVVLGAKYSTPCDMWSLACLVFELATGEYLFDPRKRRGRDRDTDHLALFMERLGPLLPGGGLRGRRVAELFDRNNRLRQGSAPRGAPGSCPLHRVLAHLGWPEAEARGLAAFLAPMLDFVPERRARAADMLRAPWLGGGGGP
jgi:serine/threonine-protein kinase SRPK3